MKVDIIVPNDGELRRELVTQLFTFCRGSPHALELKLPQAAPVDNNRNIAVAGFLEGDAEWLLFIDSDNPPTGNPLTHVDSDKDIIGFPTPMWNHREVERRMGSYPILWNVFRWEDDRDRWREWDGVRSGVVEVHAIGTGAILIRRCVLEKVRPAFIREWREDGTVEKGSDLLFCKRAKEAGFRVWCDWDTPCRHLKTINLYEANIALGVRDVSWASTKRNINTEEYWDGQWSEREAREYPYHDFIVRYLSERGAKRVLDFGCGRGDLLAKLTDALGQEVCGCDLSGEAVKICKERGLGAWKGSAVAWSDWDAVVATEVLEHLDDDEGWLNAAIERTKCLIYAVPFDCLPPGLEPEHKRVYTIQYVKEVTPKLQQIRVFGDYLVVIAGDAAGPSD